MRCGPGGPGGRRGLSIGPVGIEIGDGDGGGSDLRFSQLDQ